MSVRQLIRRFAHAPLFTVTTVVTLALGIGATAAMYAVIDNVLLEPLPYPEPDRLVGVWHEAPGLDIAELNQGPAFHWTYRAESRVFEDVAMWRQTRATITGLAEPEEVDAVQLTEGALELLGVRPILGRTFSPEDDRPGAPLTTMIGHGLWQQRFGADRHVLGRTLLVNGKARVIIGVLPAGFRFLRADPAVLLPYQLDPNEMFLGNFSHFGFARLRPGATIAQANADVQRMIGLAAERFAAPGGLSATMLADVRLGPNVRPLARDVIGDIARVLWLLLGTVAIVLVIACANVANLFLVRAEGRYREVAVRSALGASRARLAADFLAESIGIALFSAVLGLGIAAAALRLLRLLAPEGLPRLENIAIDGSVLLGTGALALACGLLLGVIPMLRHARLQVSGALREGGRGGSAGRARHRVRGALVAGQLALAIVLLVGSGLMLRSVQAMRDVRPGFEHPAEVLTLRLSIPPAEIEDPLAVIATHERLLAALAAVPGVRSVAAASGVTMEGINSGDPVFVEDFPTPETTLPPIRRYKWITPGYFATLQAPLVAGRDFTWDDVRQHRHTVVISENLAREYWGSASAALGRRIRNSPGNPWREIVGVAADARDDGIDQPAPAIVHFPILVDSLWDAGLQPQRSLTFALRLARPFTPPLMDEVRQAVWSVNPNLPLARVRTLDRILAESMARSSFTLVMLAIAAGAALLLGAIGLYGVTSYIVSQRTREFGVRLALGARARDVGGMVIRQASRLVLTGLAVGLLAAAALTRLMGALLFGVAPLDPLTFTAVALTLAAVALLAAWVPARRAARVDPIEALRWE